MLYYPEFRNLFYYRLGHKTSRFISFLCPKMNTLFINCPTIGPGLFIQHGFATIIEAKSIGKNCWINQQVTIGFSNERDCPVIHDNVIIIAGVKIIGNVIIGNNSKIGANSVVVKNVPENCTVVGIPSYIVKRNGLKVKEYL
jgi:serine O-acetyltransferase